MDWGPLGLHAIREDEPPCRNVDLLLSDTLISPCHAHPPPSQEILEIWIYVFGETS